MEEGKEPPAFDEIGQMVRVTFPGQKVDQTFKARLSFLTDKNGTYLDVDDLLLLHFFRRQRSRRTLAPYKEEIIDNGIDGRSIFQANVERL